MKYLNNKIPIKEIKKVFKEINAKDILFIANSIQKNLKKDSKLILNSKDAEYKLVTQADIKIQKLLLDYFNNSSLKGTYEVITEEQNSEKNNNEGNITWKLIIDPLDGTSSFIKQTSTWGIMVGACDCSGILRYSWNLMSNGDIYSSGSKKIRQKSLKKIINEKKSISIDIYDYDASSSRQFKNSFKTIYDIQDNQITQTSYPAAICAGYELYKQSLDYLLWLPSDRGKKNYPSYDLIFLGALFDRGYNVIIGKNGNDNSIVTVGPTLKDTEKIYEVGLNLLSMNERKTIRKIVNKLKITN